LAKVSDSINDKQFFNLVKRDSHLLSGDFWQLANPIVNDAGLDNMKATFPIEGLQLRRKDDLDKLDAICSQIANRLDKEGFPYPLMLVVRMHHQIN